MCTNDADSLTSLLHCIRAGKNLGFLEKVFRFFKGFLKGFKLLCPNKIDWTQNFYPGRTFTLF